MKYLIVVIVAVAIGQATAEKLRFDNHTLYRVIPKTPEMVEELRKIEETAYASGFNFFTELVKENIPVDILVPPKEAKQFKELLEQADIEGTLLNENIQNSIDREGFRPEVMANTFGWTNYHTLDEINAWLRDFAFNYDDKVTLLRGGRTFQGREILGVRVSLPGATTRRKAIFIESNIHAREWVTSAVATYILNELVVSQDREVRELASLYDWYIFPVTNPDGFVHSHNNNRMWRKTRTPYSLLCFGADPNRNWPYQWMQGGASNQPCSDTYAGPSPLSETSTDSLAFFIDTVGDDLIAYISFHSFSQMLLLPYGHTTAHLDNYDEMLAIGRQAIRDLAVRYGTQYVVGNIAETIYVASGGSMDYVKHKFGTPIAYTYELRDRGQNGFLLPSEQIIPTALETLDSLVSIFKSYRERHPNASAL